MPCMYLNCALLSAGILRFSRPADVEEVDLELVADHHVIGQALARNLDARAAPARYRKMYRRHSLDGYPHLVRLRRTREEDLFLPPLRYSRYDLRICHCPYFGSSVTCTLSPYFAPGRLEAST